MSATAGIDPRIRARRVAVQRDLGRRRLRRLVALAGVTGVVGAGWAAIHSPLLDVDQISVDGAARSGHESVAGATGVRRGAALATVDLGKVAERVASLPWVETADVSRSWPGTLRVRVVERQPTGAVPVQSGGWLLLDATGRQLAVTPEPPAEVVRIEIPPVRAQLGERLAGRSSPVFRFAASVPASARSALVALRSVGDGVEGTVRLGNGATATVLFGRAERPEAAWQALVTVLEDVEPRGLSVIDVRVPAAPALTRS